MLTKVEYRLRELEASKNEWKAEVHALKEQVDKLKEILDQVIFTANSTYKKKKVLEEVDDFLSKRLNGR